MTMCKICTLLSLTSQSGLPPYAGTRPKIATLQCSESPTSGPKKAPGPAETRMNAGCWLHSVRTTEQKAADSITSIFSKISGLRDDYRVVCRASMRREICASRLDSPRHKQQGSSAVAPWPSLNMSTTTLPSPTPWTNCCVLPMPSPRHWPTLSKWPTNDCPSQHEPDSA